MSLKIVIVFFSVIDFVFQNCCNGCLRFFKPFAHRAL